MDNAAFCASIAILVFRDRLHPFANGCAETQGLVGLAWISGRGSWRGTRVEVGDNGAAAHKDPCSRFEIRMQSSRLNTMPLKLSARLWLSSIVVG